MNKTIVHGFMCSVDFYDEIGVAFKPQGFIIYGSLEDCKSNMLCANVCGIVEVELNMVKEYEGELNG